VISEAAGWRSLVAIFVRRSQLNAGSLGGTYPTTDILMTSASFRKLALALPGAEERVHMNHPDFRVGGKIFATMGYPGAGWAMIALTPEDQVAFVAMKPEAFVPVKGKWGEQGATSVVLRYAKVAAVRAALAAAYEARVSKTATERRSRKAPRSRRRAT
jgi:hypothetical protein